MATEFIKVVKEGYEQFHAEATEKLNNIDNEIEIKVAEYRETVIAEKEDDKIRLQHIIDICTEEKEVEVSDVVEETIEDETPKYVEE